MKKLILVFIGIMMIVKTEAQLHIRLMSYNMRYDNPDDGDNRWEIRRDALTGLLQYHAPDFIGTQELLNHQLEYVLSKLPGYGMVGVARLDGKKEGEYACILYNTRAFRVITQHTFWLSPFPDSIGLRGWDADQERICTYGLFEDIKTGLQFYVFNTHFDHIGAEARLQSARLIWDKMTALNNVKKLPVFLMGDFNSRPNEAPAMYLSERMQNARNASEIVYGAVDTWNDFAFSEQPKGCIDYIFTAKDPRIKVKKFATLTDSYNRKYPSDHLPVVADFIIQKK
ncbi:endonuclease/exonuclease/phosphatase family protein [Flavihumibacter profundi]|uniref:endonuclease/exonuclease/phosphatase family protein n=1 Tax=Flavihumibacter profundi TaxID=2716883 RepID=UPI001CC65821|nr:endonuclease/exonuclease/phosphatase family protein [Flavihumibacter profundi]MBZ5859210.1 endonuclease/exonuclease/phosphatase family protein [Flavihumibacter profundi]